MADDIQTNVVLTADNTQYDQAMVQSAQSTDNLGKSVDSLGQKISNLTKAAGKGLVGIAAADVAMITAATAAWSSYEKQVSQLAAQAAVLSRTQDQQKRVMGEYERAVKGLRTEYGTATGQAAKLVEVLAKVTSTRQSRDLKDLSKVFEDMSKATGESSEGLASSLTNLQKVMGTPINAKQTREYADQFTYLAAQTNTTATALIDFTTQLAPIGRAMDMRQEQVTGFATAFARAGQDGLAAANVFTKIGSDISKSMATGSPEIAHYANLIGVTTSKFKEMESAEQVVQIIEALQRMGPRAATELNRLGLDGVRSMKALTGVINQQGGIRQAMGLADDPNAAGSAARGREAAMQGLADDFEKLREEMKMTAEAMATVVGPALGSFVTGMEKAAGVMREMAEGPMGKFLQLIMGIVAPLAGGAGAMLLFAGTLLKVAAAFTLLRNSASMGVREGFRGGAGITMGPDGQFIARGEGTLGRRGAQIAEGGTWLQRGMYNVGQMGGAGIAGGLGSIREGWLRGREWYDPDYQRPGRRGPLSFLAGGLGRGIETFMTPQFDQMRYADPSRRTQWAARLAPFTPTGTRLRQTLGIAEGAVATERAGLGAIRQQEAAVRGSMLFTDTGRAQRLEDLKIDREATKQRLYAAQEAVRATKDEVFTRQQNSAELKANTTGFQRLGKAIGGFAMGGTGAIIGGGVAAGGAIARSPMGVPIAGMAAAGIGAATGIGGNTLMMAGMGAAAGPWGAAIGAGIGMTMDATSANDELTESIGILNEQAEETAKSGSGLTQLAEDAEKTQENLDKFTKSVSGAIPAYTAITDPKRYFGAKKNMFEDIFGKSDVEEMQDELDKGTKVVDDTEKTLRDLAKKGGVEVSGTARNQRRQLEEFAASTALGKLADAGYDLEDLVEMREKDPDRYKAMIARTMEPKETRQAPGVAGRALEQSYLGQQALKFEDDVTLAYKATRSMFQEMREGGMSYLEIVKATESEQAKIGDENDKQYELQAEMSRLAQEQLQYQMPLMTRGQGLQAQVGLFEAVAGAPVKTVEQAQQLEAITANTSQMFIDTAQQVKQMLLAQEQFNRQQARAEEDYNEQRRYAEFDYQLGRERAEEDYQRQRRRATADYYRGIRRAQYDFHLSRQRQEEDFNHQVAIMAKQAATTVYDIYQRVQTQRTSSAEWLLSNAGDQLARMQEQAQNLDRLREMGLSSTAIQQLKLTDPQNAQQLARFVTEVTPQMIRQFNRTAGAERVKAAREIVTDPSSLEWMEMRRGFRVARRRAGEDFERQMKLSRQDFRRGLSQQDQDFKQMMDRQAEDFERGMDRQEKAYKKTMDRAAEDMAHMADEISGSLESILIRGTKELSGSAQKQAQVALQAFRNLKTNLDPEAQAVMRMLADRFGFEYKAPKAPRGATTQVGGAAEGKRGAISDIYRHEGGTVPGWSPGRDTTTVNVSGGEAIMRPEWTRAIGESAINAMNHQAKYGGFAAGGVFWPVPGQQTSTYRGHDGVDINRGSGSDDFGDPIRAFRGGKIIYVGSGRGYGDAIFQRTAAGTVVYGHTSAQYVHAGQVVRGGQMIGLVGSTGNSSAPHLHFGIPGGTFAQAMALLQGAIISPMELTERVRYGDILKRWYPRSENSAYEMQGVHPLDPGMISKVINRFGRRKIDQLNSSLPAQTPGGAIGREPTQNLNNQQLVRVGANRYGWGDQWQALRELVMHESGFNNTAQNPTSSAYGMFQFLDSTWRGVGGHKTSNPWLQTQYGLKYIKQRYGDPTHAWRMWQSRDPHWYADGAMFTQPNLIGVGENGPEAVIPLNQRGGEFLADAMNTVMGGRNVAQMRNGMAIYNTRVDRSTNFNGPITVQANDPHELITKLQARQRVMALSRPSLTGSAA